MRCLSPCTTVCDVTNYVGHIGEGTLIEHDLFMERHTPFSTVRIKVPSCTPLKHGRVKSQPWDLLEVSGQLHTPLALPVTHSVGGFGEKKNLLLQIGMEPVFPFRLPSGLNSTLTVQLLLRFEIHGSAPLLLRTSVWYI